MSRVPETLYSVKGAQFAAVELPVVKEVRGKEYMKWGADNLFPQELIELYNTSAMHATAVTAVSSAIKGEGIKLVGQEYVNLSGAISPHFSTALNATMVWTTSNTKLFETRSYTTTTTLTQ